MSINRTPVEAYYGRDKEELEAMRGEILELLCEDPNQLYTPQELFESLVTVPEWMKIPPTPGEPQSELTPFQKEEMTNVQKGERHFNGALQTLIETEKLVVVYTWPAEPTETERPQPYLGIAAKTAEKEKRSPCGGNCICHA